MKLIRNIIRWVWCVAREDRISPTLVDYPSTPEPLRFVFVQGEACHVVVWCSDHTVVSSLPKDGDSEISIILPRPAIAMGTVNAKADSLFEVYVGDVKVTRAAISAYACDVSRSYTYYVPRWRAVWEWVQGLGKEPDEDL